MINEISIGADQVVYDLTGEGPLVVLAHGIGDSRHSYRFVAPALAAGYRVANVDLPGCGDSSLGWGTDWADPRAEGERVVADLPEGLGELAVLEGVGHHPHAQAPDALLALVTPFLARVLPRD